MVYITLTQKTLQKAVNKIIYVLVYFCECLNMTHQNNHVHVLVIIILVTSISISNIYIKFKILKYSSIQSH